MEERLTTVAAVVASTRGKMQKTLLFTNKLNKDTPPFYMEVMEDNKLLITLTLVHWKLESKAISLLQYIIIMY